MFCVPPGVPHVYAGLLPPRGPRPRCLLGVGLQLPGEGLPSETGAESVPHLDSVDSIDSVDSVDINRAATSWLMT